MNDYSYDINKEENTFYPLNSWSIISLLYPLSVPNANEVNQEEKDIIKEIFEVMKINKTRSFYMKDLISLDDFNIKKAEIALRLSKEDTIQPILSLFDNK